jgi:hypothetical protein
MELCVEVADDFLNELKRKLGISGNAGITREAFTILNWAADVRAAGRDIVSEERGHGHARLAMPTLERIRARTTTV